MGGRGELEARLGLKGWQREGVISPLPPRMLRLWLDKEKHGDQQGRQSASLHAHAYGYAAPLPPGKTFSWHGH